MSVDDITNNLTDQQREVFMRAIDLALTPPVKRTKHRFWARVRWDDIDALREELEACGVDWRETKRRHDWAVRQAQDARRRLAPYTVGPDA